MATTSNGSRPRGPHPLAAAALSAVWPGLGHLGHRNRRALLLITATLGCAVIALALAAPYRLETLLAWSVSRSSLRTLIAAAAVLLVFRIAVAVDAYRTAALGYRRPRRGVSRRLSTGVALVLITFFIAAPHVVAIRFAAAQIDLLSNVFDATGTQTATATPVLTTESPGTTATTSTETSEPITAEEPATTIRPARTTTTREASTTVLTTRAAPAAAGPTTSVTVADEPGTTTRPPSTTPTTSAEAATTVRTNAAATTRAPTTTRPAATWDGADRLTIALLGSDAGFDRYGVRTDTIIVLSIDVNTGDAAAFNVPRNWQYLTFPDGTPASQKWPQGYPGLANEVYGLAERFPEAFAGVEDPAGHAVKSALAQLTGLDIQYYVLLDMVGFVATIDLFGGIDVYVTETIDDRVKPIVRDGPYIDIEVGPGDHHFDGLTALAYVRARRQSSDYHRMTRQRCVVGAFIDQITPTQVLTNFLALTTIIADHISTDIPLDRLNELITLAGRLDTSRMVSVNFIPPEFPRGYAPTAIVREAVTHALRGTTDATNDLLSDSCRGPQPDPR